MNLRYLILTIVLMTSTAHNLHAKPIEFDFHDALWEHDFDKIKKIVERGKESLSNTVDNMPIIPYVVSDYALIKRGSSEFIKREHFETDLPTTLAHARKILIFLIEKGAPIDATGRSHKKIFNDKTALEIAIDENLPEIVELLLDHGASTTLRNKYGLTAYEVAVEKYNESVHTKVSPEYLNNRRKIKEILSQRMRRPGFKSASKSHDVMFSYK